MKADRADGSPFCCLKNRAFVFGGPLKRRRVVPVKRRIEMQADVMIEAKKAKQDLLRALRKHVVQFAPHKHEIVGFEPERMLNFGNRERCIERYVDIVPNDEMPLRRIGAVIATYRVTALQQGGH